MRPTTPLRCNFSVLATDPARGLSLSPVAWSTFVFRGDEGTSNLTMGTRTIAVLVTIAFSVIGVLGDYFLKLASVRGECGLKEAVNQAQEAGRKYISVASQILAAN